LYLSNGVALFKAPVKADLLDSKRRHIGADGHGWGGQSRDLTDGDSSIRKRLRSTEGVADDSLISCSVGIMAYNEEANIANAIATVFDQDVTCGTVAELIVVASGCTDATVDIVAELAAKEPRIGLIVQDERAGKASAINLFIETAQSPVLLMVGADTLVADGTIGHLLQHFRDPEVGMVGGHPIPVNDEETFLGHSVHLVWRLHDRIARRAPKLGEIVAYRNVIGHIPTDTAVDEISIEAAITELGYRLVYEPRAVVYNKGPMTVGDFLRQRRRIAAGHHEIAKMDGYFASTMSVSRIVGIGLRSGMWTLGAVALEGAARGLGYYDFRRHRQHHIWDTATSTKTSLAKPVTPLHPRVASLPEHRVQGRVEGNGHRDVVIDLTAASALSELEDGSAEEVRSSWG
jgi:biofilm PGA synthesis N-glycosyltransferase PgaC